MNKNKEITLIIPELGKLNIKPSTKHSRLKRVIKKRVKKANKLKNPPVIARY